MKGTPEQNIDQIHGTISGLIESMSVLNKISDGNDQQIRANMLAIRQFAVGMAEHDKKIKGIDKLINMLVSCGTAKDQEEENTRLYVKLNMIKTKLEAILDFIDKKDISKADTMLKVHEQIKMFILHECGEFDK